MPPCGRRDPGHGEGVRQHAWGEHVSEGLVGDQLRTDKEVSRLPSQFTSTIRDRGDRAPGRSVSLCRTQAPDPSVQKNSSAIGSADTAAVTPNRACASTTSAAASGISAAKLSVPHNGSTSQRRSLPAGRAFPVSSPSKPSPCRAAEITRRIAFSAARSASVAKSVGDFASSGQIGAVWLLTAAPGQQLLPTRPRHRCGRSTSSDCSSSGQAVEGSGLSHLWRGA